MTGPETDLQFDKLYADSAVPSFSRRRRHCGLIAVALSIVIHACLIMLGFLLSVWTAARPGLGLFALETRVHAGPELSIVLVEASPAPAVKAAIGPSPPAPLAPRSESRQTYSTPVYLAPRPSPLVSRPSFVAARPSPVAATFSGGQTEKQGLKPASAPYHGDGGRGATGRTGGPGKPSFFQIETEAQSVVYVIDRSASMGPPHNGLSRAKAELLASLEQLPQATLFQIIAYNGRAETLCINGRTDLVPATPDNKRAARLLVEAIRDEGGTDHFQALHRALALRANVLFFLTDADDLRPAQILALTHFNGGRTIVNAIGLKPASGSPAPSPLQMLAQENRGLFRLIDTSR